MYAYVGVLLLGSVRWNRGLTEHANFSRFWTALLTLLRVATGDNWVDVMAGCRVQVGSCVLLTSRVVAVEVHASARSAVVIRLTHTQHPHSRPSATAPPATAAAGSP